MNDIKRKWDVYQCVVGVEKMSEEPTVRLPILYIGAEDVPVLLGNNFVIQHVGNEFILTVGQMTPPITLGDPDQQVEQLKKLSYVSVRVVARIGFTRQRMVELIQILQENLKTYDQRQKGGIQ